MQVHRGPGYVSTLRMYSSRTRNTECTNSENVRTLPSSLIAHALTSLCSHLAFTFQMALYIPTFTATNTRTYLL